MPRENYERGERGLTASTEIMGSRLAGRKQQQLHGAWEGGWTAGYHNSVGSKQGWTPSAYVKGQKKKTMEDFMDEEDLRDMMRGSMRARDEYARGGAAAADGAAETTATAAPRLHRSADAGATLQSLLAPCSGYVGTKLMRRMRAKARPPPGTAAADVCIWDSDSDGTDEDDDDDAGAATDAAQADADAARYLTECRRKLDKHGVGFLADHAAEAADGDAEAAAAANDPRTASRLRMDKFAGGRTPGGSWGVHAKSGPAPQQLRNRAQRDAYYDSDDPDDTTAYGENDGVSYDLTMLDSAAAAANRRQKAQHKRAQQVQAAETLSGYDPFTLQAAEAAFKGWGVVFLRAGGGRGEANDGDAGAAPAAPGLKFLKAPKGWVPGPRERPRAAAVKDPRIVALLPTRQRVALMERVTREEARPPPPPPPPPVPPPMMPTAGVPQPPPGVHLYNMPAAAAAAAPPPPPPGPPPIHPSRMGATPPPPAAGGLFIPGGSGGSTGTSSSGPGAHPPLPPAPPLHPSRGGSGAAAPPPLPRDPPSGGLYFPGAAAAAAAGVGSGAAGVGHPSRAGGSAPQDTQQHPPPGGLFYPGAAPLHPSRAQVSAAPPPPGVAYTPSAHAGQQEPPAPTGGGLFYPGAGGPAPAPQDAAAAPAAPSPSLGALFKPLQGSLGVRFASGKKQEFARGGAGSSAGGDAPMTAGIITPQQLQDMASGGPSTATAGGRRRVYGRETHEVREWFPAALLCRRFGVEDPHPEVRLKGDAEGHTGRGRGSNTQAVDGGASFLRSVAAAGAPQAQRKHVARGRGTQPADVVGVSADDKEPPSAAGAADTAASSMSLEDRFKEEQRRLKNERKKQRREQRRMEEEAKAAGAREDADTAPKAVTTPRVGPGETGKDAPETQKAADRAEARELAQNPHPVTAVGPSAEVTSESQQPSPPPSPPRPEMPPRTVERAITTAVTTARVPAAPAAPAAAAPLEKTQAADTSPARTAVFELRAREAGVEGVEAGADARVLHPHSVAEHPMHATAASSRRLKRPASAVMDEADAARGGGEEHDNDAAATAPPMFKRRKRANQAVHVRVADAAGPEGEEGVVLAGAAPQSHQHASRHRGLRGAGVGGSSHGGKVVDRQVVNTGARAGAAGVGATPLHGEHTAAPTAAAAVTSDGKGPFDTPDFDKSPLATKRPASHVEDGDSDVDEPAAKVRRMEVGSAAVSDSTTPTPTLGAGEAVTGPPEDGGAATVFVDQAGAGAGIGVDHAQPDVVSGTPSGTDATDTLFDTVFGGEGDVAAAAGGTATEAAAEVPSADLFAAIFGDDDEDDDAGAAASDAEEEAPTQEAPGAAAGDGATPHAAHDPASKESVALHDRLLFERRAPDSVAEGPAAPPKPDDTAALRALAEGNAQLEKRIARLRELAGSESGDSSSEASSSSSSSSSPERKAKEQRKKDKRKDKKKKKKLKKEKKKAKKKEKKRARKLRKLEKREKRARMDTPSSDSSSS